MNHLSSCTATSSIAPHLYTTSSFIYSGMFFTEQTNSVALRIQRDDSILVLFLGTVSGVIWSPITLKTWFTAICNDLTSFTSLSHGDQCGSSKNAVNNVATSSAASRQCYKKIPPSNWKTSRHCTHNIWTTHDSFADTIHPPPIQYFSSA